MAAPLDPAEVAFFAADQSGVHPLEELLRLPEGPTRGHDVHDTVVDTTPPVAGLAPWEAEARLGTVVAGCWRLQRVLGHGATAVVYEARHERTGEPVALKVLRPTWGAGAEQQARFFREARTAARIRHPNVVRVHDVGCDFDGSPYQVQELLAGEDLGSVLQWGPLPLRNALSIARQVLAGLDAVHAHGVIHRDVKPENIIVWTGPDCAPRVKLLDFGIAMDTWAAPGEDRLTRDGIVLGTPHYMSPEQIRGDELGVQSDLWAVGAVLFHALTGSPPFDSADLPTLLRDVAFQPAPSLLHVRPDLPRVVIEAVDGALRRDPASRWQSAQQMAAALGTIRRATNRRAGP